MVYRSLSDVDFSLDSLPSLPMPRKVLLVTPTHFDVTYVINPHMEGHIGQIDRDAALRQWQALRAAYERIGIEPLVLEGEAGLPDMVFCANQTLPFYLPGEDRRGVVLSLMHAAQRVGEVPFFERFLAGRGYDVLGLPSDLGTSFEGMGDAIWHPGRFLLWGGYGFRTGPVAYEHVSSLLNVPVLALSLTDPDFYHLDTCFSVLDEQSVLIYPGAFQPEGLDLIRHFFPRVVEAPEDEARHLFACNAHCPDRRHVLIQKGCARTVAALREAGFEPIELETGEFLKSGGSVFCMKQMLW